MIRRTRIFSSRAVLLALAAALPPATSAAAQADRDPPLDAVVDSAALVRDLAALRLELPRGTKPLFSIRFDSTGAVDTVRATLHSLPAAYADPVVAAIRARLRPQQPSKNGRFTYLRAIAGPGARIDRPRLRERQPELLNRTETARALARVAQQNTGRLEGMGGMAITVARFRVNADGTTDAASAAVQRSSGDQELDLAAVAAVADMRFRPAAIEDEPVRVWVTIPISFQLSAPRRSEP